jgi:hypothetical protein
MRRLLVRPSQSELATNGSDGASTGMSRAVRCLSLAAAVGFLAFPVPGMLSVYVSNFVPSALTVACARWLAICTGVFYGVFFIGIGELGWNTYNSSVAAVMQKGGVTTSRWYVRAPVMALVYFGFAWASFSSALPWMINGVLGSDKSMTVEIDGWRNITWSRPGKQCARPTLHGIPFGMLSSRAICVPDPDKSKFKAGASLVLYGRASALGISPEHYRIVNR